MTEMINFSRHLKTIPLLLLLTALIPAAKADNGTVLVNVVGKIISNPCKVNNGKAISVEFGTIPVNELTSATKTFPVTITCANSPSGTVELQIKGTASSFDSRALATDVTGLGVSLSHVAASSYGFLDLNTFYDVTTTFGLTSKKGTFNLTAKLTTDGTTTFSGGDFNASATLVMQMS